MRICFVHGFAVSDPSQTFGPLVDAMQARGHDCRLLDYGWAGLVRIRFRTEEAAERLAEINPDATIAHSNGNVVVYEAAQQGMPLKAHVAYQPAMRRDTVWPASIRKILVLHNPNDLAVEAGRVWRWVNPVAWFWNHPWGTAGRHGFETQDRRITQWRVSDYHAGSRGHSYLHDPYTARVWAPRLNHWLTS